MAAVKKSDTRSIDPEPREADAERSARLKDVSNQRDLEGTDSPARRMQADLQDSISEEPQPSSPMSIGRVLAVSSGITTLLGVFIFSGIW